MNANYFSFLFKMAWRDSRRNRSRLILFVSSIVLGIAALVAINSFSVNLQKDINSEAKALIGADLVLDAHQIIPPNINLLMDTLGQQGERASEINFVSMILFPKEGSTRLAQIKALEGNFPFYGKLKTTPENASDAYKNGQNALVDKTMMLQFGLQIGDSVKVGDLTFFIKGQLDAVPGQAGIGSAIAPSVIIPKQYLDATGLVQKGSRVNYNYYFKFRADKTNIESYLKKREPTLKAASVGYETVDKRKESLGTAFSNMTNYLNLVGFVALLLGCVGVASAVHIYIKDKLSTVAVLRCIGASGQQAFLMYLFQIVGMGLLGAILGATLGSLIQQLLPLVLKDFLPIENVSNEISWKAIWVGISTGLGISILFAMLPLLAIRNISPLRTLRGSFEEETPRFDALRWGVIILILLFVGGFAYFQIRDIKNTIAFEVGIIGAFLLLAGVAQLLMFLLKRFFPTGWNYVFRQGMANLYRPNNQTVILISSIGLGTLLITTLFLIQNLLLNQVQLSGSGVQPNMILFDIQSSQKERVKDLAKAKNLPILQEVPIITMRLESYNGKATSVLLKDSTSDIAHWTLEREYRCTYRDSLIETEKILEGTFHKDRPKRTDGVVYISLAERVATAMHAKVGAKMTFNVQGTMIETEVSDIRQVNFNRVQTNFFIVFPTGILEKAPQFHVIVTRTPSPTASAEFQSTLVKNFPNVSAIDLTQILKTVDEVLGKISFVIRFMALFSILTGLIVLMSSVILSKYQRVQESVLLRTLGAQGRQILMINGVEYFLLGALASLTGIALSVLGAFLLAKYAFHVPFAMDYTSCFIVFFVITLLTILIGMFNSRDVLKKSPLEVLRAE